VNIVARDPFASEGTTFRWSDWDIDRWGIEIWNPWRVNIGGTNTATFVVRRHGITINTNALIVHYEISGTASNGVDYVALPGSVSIPGGKRTAQIVVAPIDDNRPEGIETVALTLQPSPDYAVGFPSRAAASSSTTIARARPACCCRTTSSTSARRLRMVLLSRRSLTDLRNWVPSARTL
jgi:hypothetical protein